MVQEAFRCVWGGEFDVSGYVIIALLQIMVFEEVQID
jgi:hypothetical protein